MYSNLHACYLDCYVSVSGLGATDYIMVLIQSLLSAGRRQRAIGILAIGLRSLNRGPVYLLVWAGDVLNYFYGQSSPTTGEDEDYIRDEHAFFTAHARPHNRQ